MIEVQTAAFPTWDQREAIEALVGDQYEPAWYTTLNAEKDRPAWFLAWAGTTLVGFLTVFAPGSDAEVQAWVAPEHRRQGVFRSLWDQARRFWEAPGRRWLLVVDRRHPIGATVAGRWGRLTFTESTLVLPAGSRPGFEGLPDGLTLAPVGPDTALAAARVLARANQDEDHRSFVDRVLGDTQRTLLALHTDTVVAVGGLHRGPQTTLFALAVDPDHQGKGWGRALVLALLDVGAPGTEEFLIEVDSTNARAENLYRSVGFVDQTVTDYYHCKELP